MQYLLTEAEFDALTKEADITAITQKLRDEWTAALLDYLKSNPFHTESFSMDPQKNFRDYARKAMEFATAAMSTPKAPVNVLKLHK